MTDKKYDFYIASPLFCTEDNLQLDKIESFLTENGFSFFSPRIDSKVDMSKAKTPAERDEVAQQIFDLNVNAINASKALIVNTKGIFHDNAVYCDQGTCFELGYAVAKDIPVITFNWDKFAVNIMFSQVVVAHINDIRDAPENLEVLATMKDDLISGKFTSKELRSKYFKLIQEELV